MKQFTEADWSKLGEIFERMAKEGRPTSITVTLPDRDPPRIMSNISEGIYPDVEAFPRRPASTT